MAVAWSRAGRALAFVYSSPLISLSSSRTWEWWKWILGTGWSVQAQIEQTLNRLYIFLIVVQFIADVNYCILSCVRRFGDPGCRALCAGLRGNRTVLSLSLNYCDLTSASGLSLGCLVATTAIRSFNHIIMVFTLQLL